MAMPTQARVERHFNYNRETGERLACSVDGCGGWSRRLGFCDTHSSRVRKHGDPNIGVIKTPHGEVASYMVEVVLAYDGDECLTWRYRRNKAGYAWFGKGLATRYVCEISNGHPPTPKHEAAHSCGNGASGCVTKGHLSWKTRAENEHDKIANGTTNRGERSGNAKLTKPTGHLHQNPV